MKPKAAAAPARSIASAGGNACARRPLPPRSSGFTLIEVLVALVIVVLGMSALLAALSNSAGNVAALRDKTVAEWIALNQIALARMNLMAPAVGTTEGDVDNCAKGKWHWRQQVAAVDAVPGLMSITVSVQRTGDAPASAASSASTPASRTPSGLGAPIGPLGPTAALGSVSTLGVSGCASAVVPGTSSGLAGGLGSSGSLGSPGSLGSSTSLAGPNSLGSTTARGTAPTSGTLAGSPASSADQGNDSTSSDSGASNGHPWLATVTGFRGNSLGAANGGGQDPNWDANAPNNGNSNGTTGNSTGTTGSISLGTSGQGSSGLGSPGATP